MASSKPVVQLSQQTHAEAAAMRTLHPMQECNNAKMHGPRMNEDNEPRGGSIKGWLRVLSLALMVWQPLSLGLAASSALEAVALRGWPLIIVIVIRVVVAGFGIAAGLAILGRHP